MPGRFHIMMDIMWLSRQQMFFTCILMFYYILSEHVIMYTLILPVCNRCFIMYTLILPVYNWCFIGYTLTLPVYNWYAIMYTLTLPVCNRCFIMYTLTLPVYNRCFINYTLIIPVYNWYVMYSNANAEKISDTGEKNGTYCEAVCEKFTLEK